MGKLDLYNLYRDIMQPFDCFAFSGKGNFSELIKNVTGSRFSHVALGVWMQPIIGMSPRQFCIESTTLNDVPDITGEYRKGVQIVNMAQRLEGYDGECWWFPIKDPFTEQEKLDMMIWLLDRHSKRVGYDLVQGIQAVANDKQSPWWARLIGAPIATFTIDQEDLDKLFCSELVCRTYEIGKRVPAEVNASNQTPEDIIRFPIFKDPVRLF